jgi:hypothetical protein
MHQSRALKVLNTFPALVALAMLAPSQAASAATGATLVFSFPNGFASAASVIQTGASAQISGALELSLSAAGGHQAGAAWYMTQQNIQSFTTDFTFQQDPSAVGMTFCVQSRRQSAGLRCLQSGESVAAPQ